jgi:hypothetical protein
MSETTLVTRPAYGNLSCPIRPDRVHCSVDAVCVYLHRPPHPRALATFDRRHYRVFRPRPQQRSWCWLIFFHQPTAATLAAIDRHGWPLCYVELALDWIIHDAIARTEAATFFHRHHVHPRSGDLRLYVHSRYTRGRKSRRNVVMYADRPSKMDGRSRCVHVEYRMRGAATLRAAGIHSARDLITFDHRSLWQELLTFVDLHERFGRYVMNRQDSAGRIRRTVQRRRTAHHLDRRVGWQHLHRSGSMQQLIADLRHTKFRVQRQHLIVIPTPDCLLPADTSCNGYVHTSVVTPINPCQHTKQSSLQVAESVLTLSAVQSGQNDHRHRPSHRAVIDTS